MHAVLTRLAASAASPGRNSPAAMPLAIICSSSPIMRWLCSRMIVQFSVIAAAINSCNLRSDIYSLECVFSTDPIKLRILWAAVPRDAAIFSAPASILPRMSRTSAAKDALLWVPAGGHGHPVKHSELASRCAGLWVVRASIPAPRTNGAQHHVDAFHKISEHEERRT